MVLDQTFVALPKKSTQLQQRFSNSVPPGQEGPFLTEAKLCGVSMPRQPKRVCHLRFKLKFISTPHNGLRKKAAAAFISA